MRMRVLIAAAALSLAASAMGSATAGTSSAPTQFNEFTISQFQSLMASGQLSSVGLTNYYIKRIQDLDREGPGVNAVIELNPDALLMAKAADQARAAGKNLGPLMGIPVLLKANIDTGDRMQTTAGSFALFGAPAVRDSTVAANLRADGAVILGKTNLSEWANFRSFESSSGWSGVGGETNNPYGINRNACGSSSGSGAAASANFAAVSLGTETDGSVVCPGNVNGVVGLKPTIGLTSRAGVVPISHTQDTVGVHARTVADAAMTLGVIQSPGALNDAERHRGVGHRARVDSDRVLRVRDRHYAGATGKTDRGLQADYAVHIPGADDAPVGFSAQRDRREVGRSGRAGARAGPTCVAVDSVGIVGLAADAGPSTARLERAEVGPLGKVCLAENHGPIRAQVCRHSRVSNRRCAEKRERAGGRLHPVAGGDVGFEQNRNAHQRSEILAGGSCLVGGLGHQQSVRVELDDRVDTRPFAVEILDPLDVIVGQPN